MVILNIKTNNLQPREVSKTSRSFFKTETFDDGITFFVSEGERSTNVSVFHEDGKTYLIGFMNDKYMVQSVVMTPVGLKYETIVQSHIENGNILDVHLHDSVLYVLTDKHFIIPILIARTGFVYS